MASLIGSWEWCNPPSLTAWVDYEYWRSGSDMKYKFTVYVKMNSSGGWYNDYIGTQIYINNASSYSDRGWVKTGTSGATGIKTWSWTSGELTVSNKTSGTVPFKVEICNGGGSGWRWRVDSTKTANCAVSPAASSMGTNVAGSTLSGPTVNVTKYNSDFTDNITLTYNNKTITRNSFTSSQLSFTEAERLLIFQAQGAGTTQSWSISGTTYSGSTSLGTFSGSVNITTEALSTVSAAANFNVGSATTYSTTNACGGKSRVYARVSSYTGTSVYDSGTFTGTKSSQSCTPTASSIYSSNTSSKTGTIYWRIYSYINDTEIGYVDNKTCTYTFVQSLCGPSLSTFQYKITDAGTKALMNSSGSYYNYDVSTDLGKFIKGKTTLTIKLSGSSQQSATISKYWIEIPGKSNVDASTTSGSPELSTGTLTQNGSIYACIRDSRGFESKLNFSYTLNDYFIPSFTTLTATRNAMSSTDSTADKIVKITTEISIPSYMATYIKAHTGTYYIKFEYKAEGASSWTTNGTNLLSTATQNGSKLTLSNYATDRIFDQNTQYQLRLIIVEYYTTSSATTSSQVTIPISAPLISRRTRKVGINKVPSLATLDVGGSINADSYVKAGSNVEVGTYIDFPTAYSSSTNSCTLRFKRTDGYWDVLKIVNGEIFFFNTNTNTEYELLAFEQVGNSW